MILRACPQLERGNFPAELAKLRARLPTGAEIELWFQDEDEKSNEIRAMPKLLEMLDLEGRVVTADATHTQRATAQGVRAVGDDYVLALKGNQGRLHEDVRLFPDDHPTDSVAHFCSGIHTPGQNIDFAFTCGISHMDLMIDPDVLSRTVPYPTGDADLPSSDEAFSETPCDLPDEAE